MFCAGMGGLGWAWKPCFYLISFFTPFYESVVFPFLHLVLSERGICNNLCGGRMYLCIIAPVLFLARLFFIK
jgi:hypothetical protein